jgi:ABC-type polysaccharide/polyol phosphate export permease
VLHSRPVAAQAAPYAHSHEKTGQSDRKSGLTATVTRAWAYRDLARHLIARDLRLKYKGSTLGFAWSLANPLLMATVYTVAFKYIVEIRIDRFPLFLLSGLLPWTCFAGALGAAAASIVDNGTLVRKVAFPRLVLPLSAVLSQFVQSAIMYVLIVPALAAIEGVASPALFALVPIGVLHLAFTSGLGLALAAANVHARDTRHLLEVGLQVWFWLTPIVYALALVPPRLASLMIWNPMAWFIEAFHVSVVQGTWPDWRTFLVLTLAALASAGLGLAIFSRAERRFAELV